jgi:hypothetical protein
MSSILVLYNNTILEEVMLLKSFNNNCILKECTYITKNELLSSIDKSKIKNIALVYHFNNSFQIPFFNITFNNNTGITGTILINDSSISLNSGDQLDVICDSTYDTGFTNCSISIDN